MYTALYSEMQREKKKSYNSQSLKYANMIIVKCPLKKLSKKDKTGKKVFVTKEPTYLVYSTCNFSLLFLKSSCGLCII